MDIWKDKPSFSSNRLDFQFISIDHAEWLLQLFLSKKVRTYVPLKAPQNTLECKKWIQNYLLLYQKKEAIRWVIVEKGTSNFIGTFALKDWSHSTDLAEIGYSIIHKKWGFGYATEAIETVCEFGFEKGNLNLIHAHTHPKNIASQKVLLKNRFEKEGLLKARFKFDGEYYDTAVFGKLNPKAKPK